MTDSPDLTLHRDFEKTFGQQGGLLDVSADSELHLSIGRRCVGIDAQFLANNELMIVTAVQRLYDGTLGYRLGRGTGDFGKPARPSEICWISEDEPVVSLVYRSEYSSDPETIRVPAIRRAAAEDSLKRLGWPLITVQP